MKPLVLSLLFGVAAAAATSVEFSGLRWEVAGRDAPQARVGALILPAATDLTREVPTGDPTIRLTSLPVFSTDMADLAVLGVGEASLVFVREGNTGTVMFLVPGQESRALARSIPLNEAGRAAAPVVVSLGQSGGAYFASAGTSVLTAAAGPSATREVYLSSGEASSWELLEESSSGTSPRSQTGLGTERLGRAGAALVASSAQNASANVGGSADPSSPGSSGPPGVSRSERVVALEVFTPPAVRLSRGELARQAMAQQAKKE